MLVDKTKNVYFQGKMANKIYLGSKLIYEKGTALPNWIRVSNIYLILSTNAMSFQVGKKYRYSFVYFNTGSPVDMTFVPDYNQRSYVEVQSITHNATSMSDGWDMRMVSGTNLFVMTFLVKGNFLLSYPDLINATLDSGSWNISNISDVKIEQL